MLFPNNRPHSIPICGIVTYNEDDACLAEVNRWLTEEKSRNRTAGVVHLNAIRIGELRIELPEYDANSRARAMIGHPSVESILIVLTPRDLIEHGLPLPRLDQVYASHGTLESIRKSADEEVFEVLRNSLTTEAWPMWLKPS